MKKLFFSLIATVLLSFTGSAQTTEEFLLFSPIQSERVDFSNSLVSKFFAVTSFKTTNGDVVFSETSTELLTLRNGHSALKFTVINNSKFNILYSVYNQPTNEFLYYFINHRTNKIELYSPERTLLLTVENQNGNAVMTLSTQARSAFGKCMDAVEDEFTDDFVGWLAWNTNPGVSATAAVHCQGCVRGWWGCPPAYLATIKK